MSHITDNWVYNIGLDITCYWLLLLAFVVMDIFWNITASIHHAKPHMYLSTKVFFIWLVHHACVQKWWVELCACSQYLLQGGYNAFHACAWNGHLAATQYLAPLMEGHLFDITHEGSTALHCASQQGQLSMVEYLIKSCGFDAKARNKVSLNVCWLPYWFSIPIWTLMFLHGHDINEWINLHVFSCISVVHMHLYVISKLDFICQS